MEELEYPFDSMYLLKKKRGIAKKLKENVDDFPKLKIAILGGSTTGEVALMLELFLLNKGINPSFYQSEYNKFWEDVMFQKEELLAFAPDLIYVHSSQHNILQFPTISMGEAEKSHILHQEFQRFFVFWQKIKEKFACPVIQNNFEHPPQRLLGNLDILQGNAAFINQLNQKFYAYAAENEGFYIHDLQYLSADFGLSRWHDAKQWSLYKYAQAQEAIPHLAFSVSNMIASLYGKRKKALVLDLDNTLWGGVVGEDGAENLKLGRETGEGELYLAFQQYIKSLQEVGIVLSVASKNDLENALSGLGHPDSILKPEDFLSIQANWQSKDKNIEKIAQDLQLGLDSLVFLDDNPGERELISQHLPMVMVPSMEEASHYTKVLDRSGFFECTSLSQEDKNRQKMYQENKKRDELSEITGNYEDYLQSLQMKLDISPFLPHHLDRIAQLTNKTNQFNLTTQRYSQEELKIRMDNPDYLDFSGSLSDCFGENGLVTVVLGRKEAQTLQLELWLMSCRVLQRTVEQAMMDFLVEACEKEGISSLIGKYIPTKKNNMVANFYESMGFSKKAELPSGGSLWSLEISTYNPTRTAIQIENRGKI